MKKLTDQRIYQLSYCQICLNRKYDSIDGPKCSLTNKIADFENFCENYEIDLNTLSYLQSEMDKEIERKYANKNWLEQLVSKSYLDNKKNIKVSKNKKNIFKEQLLPSYIIFISFGVFFIYLIFQVFSQQLNHLSIFEKVFGISIILFILMVFGNSILFPKQRQFIKFDEDFLEYNERKSILNGTVVNKIFWREITNLRYYTVEGEGLIHSVIIGTISQGIVEINITDLNTNPMEFIGLIKSRTKNVAQQNL